MKELGYSILYAAIFLAGFYLFDYEIRANSVDDAEQLWFHKYYFALGLTALITLFRKPLLHMMFSSFLWGIIITLFLPGIEKLDAGCGCGGDHGWDHYLIVYFIILIFTVGPIYLINRTWWFLNSLVMRVFDQSTI